MYQREYNKLFPEKVKEANKKYRVAHKIETRTKALVSYGRYRDNWRAWFEAHGMDICAMCGYNRCFSAIDFHHVNPSEKETAIGKLLQGPITKRKIMEIAKTTPLCKNCHAELHNTTKTEGRHEKRNLG